MAGVKLDARLVAQGYDRNRDGFVSDEIKVEAPIDTDGDGQVSVAELAGAIGRDQVLISGGVVKAGALAAPADLPLIRTLNSVHRMAGESLTIFGSLTPPWRYEITRTRSDGSTYSEYDWSAACTELRAKLEGIRAVTRSMNDPTSKAIHDTAGRAISSYNFGEVLDFLFDGRKGRSDYAALHGTLSSIHRMSATPPEPAATMDGVAKAVNAAAGAVGGLEGATRDPATAGAEGRVQAKAAALRQQAASIPWWQFVLVFGFFRKWSLNGKASTIEKQLGTLKAANPAGTGQQAAQLGRQAYDLAVRAGAAKTIEDAQRLGEDAKPVTTGADALRRDAEGQAKQIRDLLKSIGS